MTDIEAIRADLEQFSGEMDREVYENFSGQKDDMDTEGIYARHSQVFENEDLIYEIGERRAAAQGTDRLRMSYLYAYLVTGYIGRRTTALDDRINSTQSRSEIEVDGRKMPFQYSAVALANEPDRARREAIDSARNVVVGQLNPLYCERLEASHGFAGQFGYDGYVAMCQDLSGVDLSALRTQVQNILYRTDRLYTRHFKNMCKDILGLSLSDVRRHDVAYLFRVKEFDRFFAADRMMKVLDDTLAGMGLDGAKNIKVDAEPRERKRPRAFCCGIRVPDEIVLCIMPKGGMDDYRALFHEMGHAQHFGNVAREQAFEFKYLGDNAVTESFAFLFEHLIGNRNWLNQHFELKDEDLFSLAQFTAFQTLFMVRRYAAKLIYELELHSGAEAPEKIYAQLLGDALKFRHNEDHYLFDTDTGFYSASYLRAWMFEVQLRNVLSEKFGTTWWNERQAGEYLRGLWSTGQKFDAARMARNLGYYGIDEYPLVKYLEKSLRY
jgi:hypothetical protein